MQGRQGLGPRAAALQRSGALQFVGILGAVPALATDVFLSIAGVVIGLQSAPDGPPTAVDGAASAFLVEPAVPDIDVRAAWADLKSPPRGRLLFDSGGLWQLHQQDDEYVYSFTSPLFEGGPYRRASFDADFRRGVVTLDRRTFAGRPPAFPLEYPLDELMVINRLAFEEGVEIHGCGVVDSDGRGYLFAGQSGAGKSTIARLWAEAGATVISDDRVVLRAEGAGIAMHGTPWHGDAEFAAPVKAPLSAVMLLAQAPSNGLRALSDASAAARLFSCAFPVFHNPAALDRTLALLAKIVSLVPTRVLEFTRTPDAIAFVRSQEV